MRIILSMVCVPVLTIALVHALENANLLNDDDTGKHIKRVSAYSTLLAEKYGCDPDVVKRIKLYAPFSEQEAFKIIVDQSGTHFDPYIVELFVRNIDKIRAMKRLLS